MRSKLYGSDIVLKTSVVEITDRFFLWGPLQALCESILLILFCLVKEIELYLIEVLLTIFVIIRWLHRWMSTNPFGPNMSAVGLSI